MSFLPERFRPRFPRLWSDFFNEGTLMPSFEDLFTHRDIEIYEEDGKLHVEVPVPGLNPDEIQVSLNKGMLMVRGKREEKTENKKRKFYQASKREYSCSVALPAQIDENQALQADYDDGILNISMPLAKQAETKTITVKAKKK